MAPDQEVLAGVAARLAAAGCVAPAEEAEELLAAARTGTGPELCAAMQRRESGEPLAWITGTTRFCGHELRVDPGVYVPRPQTEPLAARAAALVRASGPGATVVDLCTGAGAVALHCAKAAPGLAVIGVDVDRRAVACARRNGVPSIVGDLGAPVADACAHVVTAVAPYVPAGAMAFLPSDVQRFEPHAALCGGADGLDVVRRVVADAAGILRPGGWLLLELGGDQDVLLCPALAEQGFVEVTTWHDEDGDLRGVAARWSGAGVPGPAGVSPRARRRARSPRR